MTQKPLLSICCVTYNQEKYIAQAIESFLMQKTSFPLEILVSDDASTDSTAQIVQNYANANPDRLKAILHSKNMGPGENFVDNLCLAQGKYIALCEGDDYWTDPLKLQKQVDYLEQHPDYSLCFHPIEYFWEDHSQISNTYPNRSTHPFVFQQPTTSLTELAQGNFIQTNSVVYRWRFKSPQEIQQNYPGNIVPGDWLLHLLHAEKGPIGFIDEVMGRYRKHNEGRWYSTNDTDVNFWLKNGLNHIDFFNILDKRHQHTLRPYYEMAMVSVCVNTLKAILKSGRGDLLQKYKSLYPEYYHLTYSLLFESTEAGQG